jgi:hypothetical protein
MNTISKLLFTAGLLLAAASCSESGGSLESGMSSDGKGGSMARFCIMDDILFTVDNSTLKSFGISNPENPVFFENRTQHLGFGIETIFPMDTLLFIGSQTGMHIYRIVNGQYPNHLSTTQHITSCDPVVAQGEYAYVTLNSNNTWCGRNTNLLQIYDISNLEMPVHIKDIRFISPSGLGVDGNKLFVCDRGLKVFDITDPTSPLFVDDFYSADIDGVSDAYDVIPLGGNLILVASGGIYQLDYTGDELKLLSKIERKI